MQLGDPLLDTNALIAWIRDDQALNTRFRGRDVVVSAVSIGELWYGVAKSAQGPKNRRSIEQVLAYAEIAEVNATIAEIYGRLKGELRSAGTPIPDNDLWIAATAIRYGLKLVTKDTHFTAVNGLIVDSW